MSFVYLCDCWWGVFQGLKWEESGLFYCTLKRHYIWQMKKEVSKCYTFGIHEVWVLCKGVGKTRCLKVWTFLFGFRRILWAKFWGWVSMSFVKLGDLRCHKRDFHEVSNPQHHFTIDLLWVACWINVKSYNVVYVVLIITNMVFTCGIYMCNCFVFIQLCGTRFFVVSFFLLHPSTHPYTSMRHKTIPNTKLKLE